MTAVAPNGSPTASTKTLTDQEINTISVTLTKDSDGFGFSVTGGSDEPYLPDESSPFITRIKEGGVAEKEGTLTVGDRIINDTLMEEKSHDDIIALLKGESTITLFVEKGAEQRILESYSQFSITPVPLTSFANLSIFKGQQDNLDDSEDTSIANIANSIKHTLVSSEIVLPMSPIVAADSKQRSLPIIYPIAAVVVFGVVAITIVRAVRSRH